MRSIFGAMFALLALIGTSWASPTSIGVFFDADATDCDATVTQYMPFTVWVYALLGTDAAANGIAGAEFRIDELGDLVWSVTPNPEAFAAVGNPCQGGCNIAFPTCMVGSGSRNTVLLYTILCIPMNPVTPRIVRVDRHTSPCDSCHFFGPLVTLCDAVYTHISVRRGEARINSGPCTVGVQPTTWTSMKTLFRAER